MSNYSKSANREYEIFHELQRDGWMVVRSAGSHGVADVVALRPVDGCSYPNHFEVRFVQVKVDSGIKKKIVTYKVETTPCGPVNVEYHKFPGRK